MTVALSSPVTGAAQTGLTSPTYTLTADIAPSINGKQYAITAVGGTQTGVETHSASKPFTISVFRPASLRQVPTPNPVTGIIKGKVPRNTYKIVVRKGVVPYANQAVEIALATLAIEIPAGADTYEPEDVRAMLSLLIGALSQAAAGLGDTVVSGILG